MKTQTLAEMAKEKVVSLCGEIPHPLDLVGMLSNPDDYWREQVIWNEERRRSRLCFAPHPSLATLQTDIISAIEIRVSRGALSLLKDWATAFGKHDSIVRNARRHSANHSSLMLDLKDAFSSIKRKHVYRFLLRIMSRDEAWIYSRLLTYRGRIPQGAPSSPRLFNLLMDRFDKEVVKAIGAPRYPGWGAEIIYTRYGDNLCLSSNKLLFPQEIEEKVRQIVESWGLHLNRKRMVGENGILVFPGVRVVHGRVQPSSSIIRAFGKAIASNPNSNAVYGYLRFLRQFPRRGRQKATQAAHRFAEELRSQPETC